MEDPRADLSRGAVIFGIGEIVIGLVITTVSVATGHPPAGRDWLAFGIALAVFAALAISPWAGGSSIRFGPRGALIMLAVMAAAAIWLSWGSHPGFAMLLVIFGAVTLIGNARQERAAARRTRVHAQQEAPRRAP